MVDKDGVKADPNKIEAIVKMPAPTKVSLLRSFLGMRQYYRGYVTNHATKYKPLCALTKENVK